MRLELIITWPETLVDLEILRQKWVTPSESTDSSSITIYHPAILALMHSLKKKRMRDNDGVLSTAHIELPFPVQTQIESKTSLLFEKTGTKIVYVELKAVTDAYAVLNVKI